VTEDLDIVRKCFHIALTWFRKMDKPACVGFEGGWKAGEKYGFTEEAARFLKN
jgi:hypothetical protein